MSGFGREAEIKCSIRALPVVTDAVEKGILAESANNIDSRSRAHPQS
jgi:hypothetical protein